MVDQNPILMDYNNYCVVVNFGNTLFKLKLTTYMGHTSILGSGVIKYRIIYVEDYLKNEI